MPNNIIKLEVLLASKKWIESFNRADIKACSQRYLNDTVMEVRPVGRYEGREEIHEFWNTFMNSSGASDLTYSNIHVEVVDGNTAKLSAQWSMNIGRGFITEELWVRDNEKWFIGYDDFTIEEEF